MLDPSDEQEAVNKRFLEGRLDDYLNRKGQNEMVASLDIDEYKISKLKTPGSSSDPAGAVNKRYIDAQLSTKLDAIPQADFDMNSNEIVNLAFPTEPESTATKQYVKDNGLSVFGRNKMLAPLNMDGGHQPS